MNKDKYFPIFSGILVSIIFGLSFIVTRGALDSLTPLQLLGYRFTFAAIILTILRWMRIIKVDLHNKKLKHLLLLVLFQPVLYFPLETAGVQLTSASQAGMMMGFIPVFTVILEIPFFKNIPSWKQFLSILLSAAGIIFINTIKSDIGVSINIWGIICLSGAIFSGAMYNIYSKKSSNLFTPAEITYLMMWAGTIVFNLIGLTQTLNQQTLGNYFTPLMQPGTLLSVLYLGALSSVVAFFLLNYMLSKTNPSQTATYLNLTTVVAILGGVLLGGETFAWYHLVGGSMIIIGVWGTLWFGNRKKPTLQSIIS